MWIWTFTVSSPIHLPARYLYLDAYGHVNLSIPKLFPLKTFPSTYRLSYLIVLLSIHQPNRKSGRCYRSHPSYIPYHRCHEILPVSPPEQLWIGSLLLIFITLFGLTLLLSSNRFLSHLPISRLILLWLILHPATRVISSKLQFDCVTY